jgi:hypothetical protein
MNESAIDYEKIRASYAYDLGYEEGFKACRQALDKQIDALTKVKLGIEMRKPKYLCFLCGKNLIE